MVRRARCWNPTVVIDQIGVTEGSDSANSVPISTRCADRRSPITRHQSGSERGLAGDQVLLTLFWEQLDADDDHFAALNR